MEAPAPCRPDYGWGNQSSTDYATQRRSAACATLVACGLVRFTNNSKENATNQPIVLGLLALLAGTVIGATAVNGLHAQNKALGMYAVLDLSAINSPVFKTLP
jgi:hypothetical protein